MRNIFLILLLSLYIISCDNDQNEKKQKEFEKEKFVEPFLNSNIKAVRTEDEDIDLYIKRQNINVIKTETGLRYLITKKTIGKKPKINNIVSIEYKTYLITGEEIYNSTVNGIKTFKIDKSNEISGLNEGVKLLSVLSEAHLIIPSHLAYGVSGDGDNILERIPIVMKIKLLEIKN